jgi:hypothetical protein
VGRLADGELCGPGSFLGDLITSLGLNLSGSSTLAYFIGLAIILGLIFVLGLAVESGLGSWISNSFDWLMMRILLVSNVYDLSKRFVEIMDRGGYVSMGVTPPGGMLSGTKPAIADARPAVSKKPAALRKRKTPRHGPPPIGEDAS